MSDSERAALLDNVRLNEDLRAEVEHLLAAEGRLKSDSLEPPQPSPCPCDHESAVGANEGCANSAGQGRTTAGTCSVSADDMQLVVEGAPANQPALLLMGSQEQVPSPFGEGLMGMTGSLVRIETRTIDGSGLATWSDLSAAGLWNAGDTRYLQIRNRDPFAGGGPCRSAFNLSGMKVVFEQ